MQVKTNLFEVEPKDFKIIRGSDTQNKFPVPSCEPIFRPREPKVPVQVSFRSLHEFSNRKSPYPHQGPVVQVSIEGRFFWFLLDTGAPITCVRRSVAYEMGWKTSPAHYQVKRDTSQESKDEKYNFLNVDRIKIADAEFVGLIYDIDDYLLERMSLRKIDGIFGCDKLTQKKVHFDFSKKKIIFYPSHLDWENLKSNLKFYNPVSEEIKTYGLERNRIFINVAINEKISEVMILDTGAGATVLMTPELTSKPGVKFMSAGIDGLRAAESADVTIGVSSYHISLEEVMLRIEDQENCLLGMDYLNHFELLLDQKNTRLCLKPCSATVKKVSSSGLILKTPKPIYRQREADYWRMRAGILYEMENYPHLDECISYLEKLDPKDRVLWQMRAALYDKNGNLKNAIRALERGAHYNPEDTDILRNLGRVQFKISQYSKAERSLRESLKLDPSDPDTDYYLGMTLVQMDRYAEALPHLEKTILYFPNDPYASLYLGFSQFYSGKIQESIPFLEKAVMKLPNDLSGFYILGEAYYKVDKIQNAREIFQKLALRNPWNVQAWLGLGKSLTVLDRLEEALQALNKAIQLSPKNADTWYFRGCAYLRGKKMQEAYSDFKKAVELQKDSAEQWRMLAVASLGIKDYAEATQAAQRAIALEPKNALAWSYLGYAYQGKGQSAQAQQAFVRAQAIDPKFVPSTSNLK